MNGYGVIFDMDGVLVDSYRAHYESWRLTARRFGVDMTEAQFAATFGRTSREIINALWPNRFDDQAVAVFDREKEAAYRDILRRRFPEMDGASDLIEALHREGFALAIGSSGPPENVALVKEHLRAGRLFQAVVSGADVRHGKPDPEVMLVAARLLNVPPARCAVIEDSLPGLESARRAGMKAVALTGTAAREQLAPCADLVVDSLRQLSPARIRQLLDGLSPARV